MSRRAALNITVTTTTVARFATLLAIAAFSAVLISGPAFGESPESPPSSTEAQCRSLLSADFSALPEAPTQLTGAEPVAAKGEVPQFCRVQGYVWPNVGFELHLPVGKWNGKFLEVGCGGSCGILDGASGACGNFVRRGYACLATDMGHKGTGRDALWAYHNLQAEIDFGFRSTHVTLVAGKAIAERFYDEVPRKSYFVGCSTGGRQGLMEAQRFPWDFDGIIAGAPALNGTDVRPLWITNVMTGTDGEPILQQSDLELLHRAVLERCDLDDGVKDGIIGNPLACRSKIELDRLTCRSGKNASCLTAQQVQAVRQIYGAPTTSKGVAIHAGGHVPGTELQWSQLVIRDKNDWIRNDFWRYLVFFPDPGRAWSLERFNLDEDHVRMDMMRAIHGATNPDLRRFKVAGGKLIAYHGWNDLVVAPIDMVDYYETVERTLGGREATQDFFRLFMIPAMGHCWDGDGPYAIDYLNYLEAWVEEGRAPEFLLGTHPREAYKEELRSGRLRLPLPAEAVAFTRPIFPYPEIARYKGKGNRNDAASFVPVSR